MYDPTKDKEYVKTIRTVLNEDDNGGEAVVVTTHIFDNGGDGVEESKYWTMSSITLNSYGRSATLDLGSLLDVRTFGEHLDQLKNFGLEDW